MNKDDVVQEIGAMLVRDPKISSRPWAHLAIVAQAMPTSIRVSGFAYEANGHAVPTGPRDLDVLDKFEDLRDAMHDPGKAPWMACLVRIDSSSSKITIDFEYDHPEKWAITPDTMKTMAEILRPTRK